MRRLLGETLSEILGAVEPSRADGDLITLTSIYFDVPLVLAMARDAEQAVLLGDLPNWRWPTLFDVRPGRIRVSCVLGEKS